MKENGKKFVKRLGRFVLILSIILGVAGVFFVPAYGDEYDEVEEKDEDKEYDVNTDDDEWEIMQQKDFKSAFDEDNIKYTTGSLTECDGCERSMKAKDYAYGAYQGWTGEEDPDVVKTEVDKAVKALKEKDGGHGTGADYYLYVADYYRRKIYKREKNEQAKGNKPEGSKIDYVGSTRPAKEDEDEEIEEEKEEKTEKDQEGSTYSAKVEDFMGGWGYETSSAPAFRLSLDGTSVTEINYFYFDDRDDVETQTMVYNSYEFDEKTNTLTLKEGYYTEWGDGGFLDYDPAEKKWIALEGPNEIAPYEVYMTMTEKNTVSYSGEALNGHRGRYSDYTMVKVD
ncbi:MAG: hypothetical protein IJT00_01915 [Lachnospiraceae bacterium]|nr:hypothetical protein [Lachnospiraceae bacterium]